MKKRIIIIEPNERVRESYNLVVSGTNQFLVTGIFADFEDAMTRMRKSQPDMLLMELDLPFTNGIEATRIMHERYPHVKVLIMSMLDDDAVILEALRAGASAFVVKTAGYDEILRALQETDRNGAYLSGRVAKAVISNYHINHDAPVTHRERQILALMAQGKTYAEIAEDLCIARETSKTHIRNIYLKLKVNTKSQAIAKATEERWI